MSDFKCPQPVDARGESVQRRQLSLPGESSHRYTKKPPSTMPTLSSGFGSCGTMRTCGVTLLGPFYRVLICMLLLCLTVACSKQDPYIPPDLFYYFASYKVGKNPTTVTPFDINQDGITDLVTTNVSSNTLSILLGNGDGSFHDQMQLHVCQEPRSLASGSFNGDAYPDIVLACAGGDQIAVLFGRADGKFEEGPQYPVHRTPVAVATDDLNGDHIADVVVALRNDKIKVFLGQGNGAFR